MKTERERAGEVLRLLRVKYPEARCELDFSTALELAVGAILAAQCTDKRVNMVTKGLFQKYRNAADWAAVSQEQLEEEVRTTGFFRNKAKAIRALAATLVEKFGGELPEDFEQLIQLPGIGRKTANLLMGDAFKQPGMIVDTHQLRVNGLLGFTKNSDATKVELDLRALVPERDWTDWSHHITWHGRYTCIARRPKCGECPLTGLCPFFAAQQGRTKSVA